MAQKFLAAPSRSSGSSSSTATPTSGSGDQARTGTGSSTSTPTRARSRVSAMPTSASGHRSTPPPTPTPAASSLTLPYSSSTSSSTIPSPCVSTWKLPIPSAPSSSASSSAPIPTGPAPGMRYRLPPSILPPAGDGRVASYRQPASACVPYPRADIGAREAIHHRRAVPSLGHLEGYLHLPKGGVVRYETVGGRAKRVWEKVVFWDNRNQRKRGQGVEADEGDFTPDDEEDDYYWD